MSTSVKRAIASACCLVALAIVGVTRAQVRPAEGRPARYWTVPGYRHGPSAFRRNFLVETTPLQEGVIDFRHYHPHTETVEFLKRWEKQYPDLVDLYVVAQSYGGIDIYQATVTSSRRAGTPRSPRCTSRGTAMPAR